MNRIKEALFGKKVSSLDEAVGLRNGTLVEVTFTDKNKRRRYGGRVSGHGEDAMGESSVYLTSEPQEGFEGGWVLLSGTFNSQNIRVRTVGPLSRKQKS